MGILSLSFIFTSSSSNTKQRRKNEGNSPSYKDPSPPPSDNTNGGLNNSNDNTNSTTSPPAIPLQTVTPTNPSGLIYLQPEYAIFTRSLIECNIHDFIRQPNGVDKNEWIANNVVAFFNHVNVLHNAICEFCTTTTCPSMVGPQNSCYLWLDERNKKVKYSAPQYIELSMIFIQKTLSDETIFPTRLDQQFPLYFDIIVRKMVRLLYHALAHMYAVHYRQLIQLQLHPHLNSLFLHFISFLITSNIISSDNATVNINSTSGNTSSLSIPGQVDLREFRAELDSLEVLYQLLANQWRHAHGQAIAQKKKAANNE